MLKFPTFSAEGTYFVQKTLSPYFQAAHDNDFVIFNRVTDSDVSCGFWYKLTPPFHISLRVLVTIVRK